MDSQQPFLPDQSRVASFAGSMQPGRFHQAVHLRRSHSVRRGASPVRALPSPGLRPSRVAPARAHFGEVRGDRNRVARSPSSPGRFTWRPLPTGSARRAHLLRRRGRAVLLAGSAGKSCMLVVAVVEARARSDIDSRTGHRPRGGDGVDAVDGPSASGTKPDHGRSTHSLGHQQGAPFIGCCRRERKTVMPGWSRRSGSRIAATSSLSSASRFLDHRMGWCLLWN
jgi:hypothetical protein